MLSGTFAVCLFFVLSGYVLTISHFRAPSNGAMLRRAIGRPVRLGLPAGVSTVATFGLFLAYPDFPATFFAPAAKANGGLEQLRPFINFHPDTGLDALLLNLFWYPWFQQPDFAKLYNGVLWTMYVELGGSLLTIAIALVAGPRKGLVIASYVVASILITRALPGYGFYFALLLLGSAIAALDPKPRCGTTANVLTTGAIVLGLCAGAGMFTSAQLLLSTTWFSGSVFVMGGGAVLVLLAVLLSHPAQRILSLPVFRWLGQISFPLYLFHWLVLSASCVLFVAIGDHVPVGQRAVMCAILAVAASLGVAAALTIVDAKSIALSKRAADFILTAFSTVSQPQRPADIGVNLRKGARDSTLHSPPHPDGLRR